MSRIVPLVILNFQLIARALALRDGLLSVLDNQNAGSKRIMNGDRVWTNEIKYQVLLRSKTQDLEDWYCGGSIIGVQHVLTAAHCVLHQDNTFFDQPLIIAVGITNFHAADIEKHQVEVEKVYVPGNFQWYENYTTTDDDIAVVKLKRRLRYLWRHSRQPRQWARVKLPAADTKNSYEGVEALVMGFGNDGVDCDSCGEDANCTWVSSGKLKKMHVRVIMNESLGCTPIENYICAVTDPSYEWGGVCYGDSGSPLVYKNTVIGVLSSMSSNPDDPCNQLDEPAYYTRVSAFLDFIKNAMMGIVTPDVRVHSWK